jgi:hypothetical protein
MIHRKELYDFSTSHLTHTGGYTSGCHADFGSELPYPCRDQYGGNGSVWLASPDWHPNCPEYFSFDECTICSIMTM